MENTADRVVLLVGTDGISYERASRSNLTGNWGGPTGRAPNNALRGLMRSGGVCTANGIDAQELTNFNWRAILSAADLGADAPTAAQPNEVLRVNLYFRSPAHAPDGLRGSMAIFAGVWDDRIITAHGVPEAGEVARTGLISFSLPHTTNAS